MERDIVKDTQRGGEMTYEVRDVVCDYGVYENGELKLILNSRRIALEIVKLLEEDERIEKLNNIPAEVV